MPTTVHDPAKVITLTSYFTARGTGMPAGSGTLDQATVRKFGQNLVLTATATPDQ
jgi:hypothetical protein